VPRYRVAVDIGGTFTDLVCFDQASARVVDEKVSTTPTDLSNGIVEVLERAVSDLRDVAFFVHGSTAGLNAFLERRGARVALITTQGFRDVYQIGRANRPDMYNLHYRKPEPLVPRRDIYEVPERILFDGSVEQPLDEAALTRIARDIARQKITSVAVCFLHSYANPAHELQAAALLREFAPDVHISLSHQVAREWREYERTSTTAINAYVAPTMNTYLERLESRLAPRIDVPIHIMQSNGGVMTSQVARSKPVQTLFSGPVGGAIGVAALGAALGIGNLIGVDMGGTSFDVSLIVEGVVDQATQLSLHGHPILTPMVRIHTIGAGGGSVAWVEGGGLRVGPRSAGAQPGPACYGRGGTEPTVTDANVVLGRVDPDTFLGGRMRLNYQAAREAVEALASQFDLTTQAMADGICRVVNANMANAIRSITVEQGLDPREFTLVAMGGAGPMHALFLAEELEIQRVVIPRSPGTFSAAGMLQTDIQHDVVQTMYRRVDETSTQHVEATFETVERRATRILSHDGVPHERMRLVRSAEMRYVGQEYAVHVLFPDNAIDNAALAAMPGLFHAAHAARYGHSNPREAVEYVNLRVTAIGRIDKPDLASGQSQLQRGVPVPASTRPIVFDGGVHQTPIYARALLQPGHHLEGPAVIEESSCTTVIPPGSTVNVDTLHNLVVSA
jgi:N-methylhydantoinase A